MDTEEVFYKKPFMIEFDRGETDTGFISNVFIDDSKTILYDFKFGWVLSPEKFLTEEAIVWPN